MLLEGRESGVMLRGGLFLRISFCVKKGVVVGTLFASTLRITLSLLA